MGEETEGRGKKRGKWERRRRSGGKRRKIMGVWVQGEDEGEREGKGRLKGEEVGNRKVKIRGRTGGKWKIRGRRERKNEWEGGREGGTPCDTKGCIFRRSLRGP